MLHYAAQKNAGCAYFGENRKKRGTLQTDRVLLHNGSQDEVCTIISVGGAGGKREKALLPGMTGHELVCAEFALHGNLPSIRNFNFAC